MSSKDNGDNCSDDCVELWNPLVIVALLAHARSLDYVTSQAPIYAVLEFVYACQHSPRVKLLFSKAGVSTLFQLALMMVVWGILDNTTWLPLNASFSDL